MQQLTAIHKNLGETSFGTRNEVPMCPTKVKLISPLSSGWGMGDILTQEVGKNSFFFKIEQMGYHLLFIF